MSEMRVGDITINGNDSSLECQSLSPPGLERTIKIFATSESLAGPHCYYATTCYRPCTDLGPIAFIAQ